MEDSQWLSQWPDGIIAVDDQYKIIFISPAAESLLGWKTSEINNESLHKIICVDTREFSHTEIDCPLYLGLQETNLTTQSGVWRKKDGMNINIDYRLININIGNNISYIVSFVNSQDLEYNQAELNKFAAYSNHSPAPIAEFDQQGYMLFGNASLQEHLLEFGFTELGAPKILPANLDEYCSQCIAAHAPISAVEINLGDVWFSWSFYPLKTGESVSVLGYAFNITDRKIAEKEARIERARSRRDFYAKMIHELRTPLNAIIGFADVLILRTGKSLAEKDMQLLKTIKASGLQLNDQVSDTLDISKIEAGKMTVDFEWVDVAKLLAEIDEQMRSFAVVKKLQYHYTCPAKLQLETDARKLKQIFVNLISNAIKYTRKGYVSVDISHCTLINKEREIAGIKISIKDTGVGIPSDQLDCLFKTYTQVKEEQNQFIQGTGIGLALVEELVRLLNAEISVESTYGEGSHFIVKLPIEKINVQTH